MNRLPSTGLGMRTAPEEINERTGAVPGTAPSDKAGDIKQRISFVPAEKWTEDEDPVFTSLCKLLGSLLRVPAAGAGHSKQLASHKRLCLCRLPLASAFNCCQWCKVIASEPEAYSMLSCDRCWYACPRESAILRQSATRCLAKIPLHCSIAP